MTEIRTTAPTQIPVSVVEARAHLRVDLTDDDVEIYHLIQRATEYAEDYTGLALCDQVWTKYADNFKGMFCLNRRPVVSVDSVKYLDTDGNQQTLATSVYRVDTAAGRVTLEYGQSWPNYRPVTNTVEIAYTAGYGTTQSPVGVVPQDIKHAILLMVGAWYENREEVSLVIGGRMHELPEVTSARALMNANRVFAI